MTKGFCSNAKAQYLLDENWSEPADISDEDQPYKLQSLLFAECKRLEANQKPLLAETVGVLAHSIGMHLNIKNSADPYRSQAEFGPGNRTYCLEDCTAEHIDILLETVARVKNESLLARINDILWIKTRPSNRKFALAAIDHYLNLCKSAIGEDNFRTRDFSARAIQLWKSLGEDPVIQVDIEDTLEKLMDLSQPEPTNFVRFFLFEQLVDTVHESRGQKWIPIGQMLLAESEKQKHFEKARKYAEQLARLHSILKDKEKARECKNRVTDLYIEEAEEMRKAGADAMLLQHRYNRAIEAARTNPNRKSKVAGLIDILVEVQEAVPGSMKRSEFPYDARELIEKQVNHSSKLNIGQAIQVVATKAIPESKAKLFEDAAKTVKEHPLQTMFGVNFVDEKGKVISQKSGMGTSDEEQSGATRFHATQAVLRTCDLKGLVIRHLQKDIRNRLDFNDEIFDEFLVPNPFVPNSRLYQIRQGLLRGIYGDWISATAILIPQIENGLRSLMQITGHQMVKVDSENIQEETYLHNFIYRSEFTHLVGEDLAFQLQVLLTDKQPGLNLRNEFSHGLMVDGTAYSNIGPFIWALMLLMIVHFQKAFHSQESDSTVDDGDQEPKSEKDVDKNV
jgi:hypothetical protein